MIVSILTISVTLLLGILGFIVNTLIQRKNNSIDIITKNRLNRRKETQEIMYRFIQYADYNSISAIINLNNQHDVIIELNYNYAKLRSLYTKTVQKDIEMIDECKRLLNTIVKYINNFSEYDKESIERDLHDILASFEKIFDLYLYTEWSRIKAETVGKRRGAGLNAWLNDFDIAKSYYEKYNK